IPRIPDGVMAHPLAPQFSSSQAFIGGSPWPETAGMKGEFDGLDGPHAIGTETEVRHLLHHAAAWRALGGYGKLKLSGKQCREPRRSARTMISAFCSPLTGYRSRRTGLFVIGIVMPMVGSSAPGSLDLSPDPHHRSELTCRMVREPA